MEIKELMLEEKRVHNAMKIQEADDIMSMLFSQEEVTERYGYECREGGRKEGRKQGRDEGRKENILKCACFDGKKRMGRERGYGCPRCTPGG